MQSRNLLFVLVIIFVNAAITNAQTCGQCISTAKSSFRSDRRTCKTNFRSGTIATKSEFKACKMMGKSNMYSDMATCYQSGNPCYAPAPTPVPPTLDWVLGDESVDCTTTCNTVIGGACDVVSMSAVNDASSVEFVANYLGVTFANSGPGGGGEAPCLDGIGNLMWLDSSVPSSDCSISLPGFRRFCCCGNNCPNN